MAEDLQHTRTGHGLHVTAMVVTDPWTYSEGGKRHTTGLEVQTYERLANLAQAVMNAAD